MFSNLSSQIKGKINHGLNNKIPHRDKGPNQSGSDQEDYTRELLSAEDNFNGSGASVGGLLRRSLTSRLQFNSTAQPEDATIFENEEEKFENHLTLQEKDGENDSEGLPIDIKEKLSKLKKYEAKFPGISV